MKRRILAVLATALGLYVPVHASAEPMKCINVQVNEGDKAPSVQMVRTLLPKGGCVRDMLGWAQVERVAGKLAMPARQWQSYQNVAAAGASNLVTLGFGNAIYGSNGYQEVVDNFGLPVTKAQLEAFTRYAVWVVSNDGGKAPSARAANIPNLYGVSIWNELNGTWDGGIKDNPTRISAYAKLIDMAGPAIRKANPSVKIIVGASVGASIDGWFTRMFANRMWGKNDPDVYLDVHPYIGAALKPANQVVPQMGTWNISMTRIRGAGITNALFATEWGGAVGKQVEANNPGLNYFDWARRSIFDTENFAGTAWFEATNFGDFGKAGLVSSDLPALKTTRLGDEFIAW